MRNPVAAYWPHQHLAFARMVIAALVVTVGACEQPVLARRGTTLEPVVVCIQPDRPWIDTGITVQKGDLVSVRATGQVSWAHTGKTTGPDGTDGVPGVFIGAGGLIGRIAGTTKTFDVGGRTRPLMSRSRRMHHYYPPPALKMPASGVLQLGFKNFKAGANGGGYEVTIESARQREGSDKP